VHGSNPTRTVRRKRMIKTVTGTSGANAAQTLTITLPANKKRIFLRHLTVTTKGADVASDIDIVINDNAVAIYPIALRTGKVFGGDFDFGKGIPIRAGDCTIVIDAGGASVVTVAGAVYEIL
jgi:hypothetical protein